MKNQIFTCKPSNETSLPNCNKEDRLLGCESNYGLVLPMPCLNHWHPLQKRVFSAEEHLYQNNIETHVTLPLRSNIQHYANKLLLKTRIMEQCHVKGNEKEHTPSSTSKGFVSSKAWTCVFASILLFMSVVLLLCTAMPPSQCWASQWLCDTVTFLKLLSLWYNHPESLNIFAVSRISTGHRYSRKYNQQPLSLKNKEERINLVV